MTTPQLQFGEQGRVRLSGVLGMDTVPVLLAEQAGLFNHANRITLDLQQVERADSAGVALLLHWLREARRQNCVLSFVNLPVQMQAIARVSGVEDLFREQPPVDEPVKK